MRLYQKTLLLISLLLIGLVAVLYGSLSKILSNSFAQLEETQTITNVKRAKSALKADLEQLDIMIQDWAAWDDTYNYVRHRNPDFVKANLLHSAFVNLQLNLVTITNLKGQSIYSQDFDLEAENFVNISSNRKIPTILSKNLKQPYNLKGIIKLPEGLMLIAVQPITDSEKTQAPLGTLIMGRYLRSRQLQALQKRTELKIKLYLRSEVDQLPQLQPIWEQLIQQEQNNLESAIISLPLSQQQIAGYTIIKDIFGKPALLMEIDQPRDIYRQGKFALHYLVISLLTVGLVFGVAMILLLQKLVLSRLSQLSHQMRLIGDRNDLSLRVEIRGKDELSSLSNTINLMLSQLESSALQLAEERQKTEKLLLNMLPESIAIRLRQDHQVIAEHFDEVTILFADIVGFTPLAAKLKPLELVNLLNNVFSQFDHLAEQLGLEKIKTIGDAYMVAAGLPLPRDDHASAIADMALAMQIAVSQVSIEGGQTLQLRIGINTGVVIAGVIGKKKLIYDLWGDAVNIASRMESSGEPGCIQVTENTYCYLQHNYILTKRGAIAVKGKGEMITYWLQGKKENHSI